MRKRDVVTTFECGRPPFKKAALGLPFFVSLPSKSLVRTKCNYGKSNRLRTVEFLLI